MIYVVATIEIAAGKRKEFLEALNANVPNVRAEEGCLEYVPTVDVAADLAAQPAVRRDTVTVVEKWRDVAALHAHLAAPHMLSYREQVQQLVERVELQVLEPA